MKLFQQLLLAPAALGLLAPLAANAAEVNINDVANYANSPKQAQALKSAQFSDVVPGDWAYTALQNLSESYGCVDNAYSQNLKSGQALTRYEAAALVNACLDGGIASADVSADAARLTQEFGTEMAILKGRVDGLEYKVKELSAGQFSSNTKLDGKIVFNTGFVNSDNNAALGSDRITSTYVAQYNLNTSFVGTDRLYTRLKAGNMGVPFDGGVTEDHGTHLVSAHASANAIVVDKLWYEWDIGDNFRAWFGPRIEGYYMLASSPSIYKPVTKQFALGGNAGTYGSSTQGGFGVAWIQSVEDRSQARWAFSTNYTSDGAANADQGLLTNDSSAKWLSKLEYGSPQWQVSLGMSKNECNNGNCRDWQSYYSTNAGRTHTGDSTHYALKGYWRPDTDSAIVPDFQLGYGLFNVNDDGVAGSTETGNTWMAGMMWSDAFIDGNRLGAAFGQPQKATGVVGGGVADPASPFAWEIYYDYQVTDGITITPAIFGSTDRDDGAADGSDDLFGALVQTTFKF